MQPIILDRQDEALKAKVNILYPKGKPLVLSNTPSGSCAHTTRTIHERDGLEKPQGCAYTPPPSTPPPTTTSPSDQKFVPPLNTVSPTLTSQRSSPSK